MPEDDASARRDVPPWGFPNRNAAQGDHAPARGVRRLRRSGTRTHLLVRNARGERQRIVQADQILFLHPARTLPRGNAIEVGTDALPEVVLEVDNTTDVRRGKLGCAEPTVAAVVVDFRARALVYYPRPPNR